jgi:hypothetical protein
MSDCEIVDAAPAGWHVLGDVLRETCRGWDWFAMMIDVDLDEAVRRPHDVRSVWVRIAGKHKSRDAARAALVEMMATRH